ncbi:MAG: pyrroloquinoline quinone-dependent dehydrogenase [Myxococcota bacterium]
MDRLRIRSRAPLGAFMLGAWLVGLAAPVLGDPAGPADWPHPGGDAGGSRYSVLVDIDRENISQLEVAWTYRHGDFFLPDEGSRRRSGTAYEATPLMVEGRLILSTPYNRVIALDAETGEELWIYDPLVDRERRYTNGYVNRGVEYWRDPEAQGFCASRIFVATIDSRLIALDVETGRVCPGFGKGGTVDLHIGIERLTEPEHHKMTSPPVTTRNAVVVGSSLADNRPVQPSGDIRGYDVRTGRPLWRFHVIPREGEFGVETWENESWRHGVGANAWAPLSADPERDLIFVPTSTASPDFYGGRRWGDNLFADSLVVLDANTGERVWHFQMIHHDLWDYDNGAQPLLVRLERDGKTIDAVAQLTKTGFVFVFERETGEPIFAIEERAVPQTDVPGEQTSPTQPFPVKPPALVPVHALTEADLWDRSPEHRERCRARLGDLRNEGIYTPPSERGSVLYPATAGGADWPGGAFDPERGILYVPTNNIAMEVYIPPLPEVVAESTLQRVMQWLGVGEPAPTASAIVPRGGGTLSIDGVSCIKPPWGSLVAVDLNRGELLWQVPIGRDPGGVEGVFNFGSLLVTAGGLVFQGGTALPELRVHHSETGELLTTFDLPVGLHAGPITYKLTPEGKQYLVVTPGGHYNFARFQPGAKMGDWVIAYTLPD